MDEPVGAQELGHPHVAHRFQMWLRRGLRTGEPVDVPADGRFEQTVHRQLGTQADPRRGEELAVGLP